MSTSDEDEILQTAIAGVRKVAEVIAALPPEQRALALTAAERSYEQTVQELGYDEAAVQSWVSAMMFKLRSTLGEIDKPA
jgi:DNA-directed RNA polymerase specialized sigma24 family protein